MSGRVDGLEVRRAEFALEALLDAGAVDEAHVRTPALAHYDDLARVHDAAWLDALQTPDAVCSVFALPPDAVTADALLLLARYGCGATLAAAQEVLRTQGRALNTSGGFHHAYPGHGTGYCLLNDVAVAVKRIRADGFTGRVLVLDVDAHSPDGLFACLADVKDVQLLSLSVDVGPSVPGLDELRVPRHCGPAAYDAALHEVVGRMENCELAFVIAGADVLEGDPLGDLGLSLADCMKRDARIAAALTGVPQVWVASGGYRSDAWKALAGSGVVLAYGERARRLPEGFDPLASAFRRHAAAMSPQALSGSGWLTDDDVAGDLKVPRSSSRAFLGYYTKSGLELALERHGLLGHLRRLGYENLRIDTGSENGVDWAHVVNDTPTGTELLTDLKAERKAIAGGTVLFVHWLSLQHPRAAFASSRPKLPGQEAPGLGLAKEAAELLVLVARRLHLDGVAFCPSWFHMAYAARLHSHFVDEARQGRFEALVRDLKHLALVEATHAVAEGRVLLNGAPYVWEADVMVRWTNDRLAPLDKAKVDAEAQASHFSLTTVRGVHA